MLKSLKSTFRSRGNPESTKSLVLRSSQNCGISQRDLEETDTPVDSFFYTTDVNTRDIASRRSPHTNRSSATRKRVQPGMAPLTTLSDEPPPAYTPMPTTYNIHSPVLSSLHPLSPTPSLNSLTATGREDPYAFLSMFNTVLLIDDSGSMAGRSWRETRHALSHLLPVILDHDRDGVDIFFLNNISSDMGDAKEGIAAGGFRNVVSVEVVERIFNVVKPRGGTPTGTRCRHILKPYLVKLEVEARTAKIDEVKPLNIIVITDGVPSDDVESVLLAAAKKLDALDAAPHQVGVQFFQVGNERGAAEALKELDDGLVDLVQGGVRDMVDTCTWMGGVGGDGIDGRRELNASGILKVVLGAVVKRLDRKVCTGELRSI